MNYAVQINEAGMPMVVASAVYAGGRRTADIDVSEACPQATGFTWVGLHEPSVELMTHMQQRFGLHPLAVEDAYRAHQRPKIEAYGDMVFMILRTAQLKDKKITYGETHVFAGPGYVITVRHGPSTSYGHVRARCESEPKLLAHGEDYVLYAIMDFVAENFFPIVDEIAEQLSEIEEHIEAHCFTKDEIDQLYHLRRELATFRRTVSPMLEVCTKLERFDLPMIDQEIRPYYRDVHDHVRQVNESIDNLREAMASAFEAAMMLSAASQNDVTKKLAAWAAMLAVPTAVAGIYGMNFEHMPELKWEYGYPAALAVIAGVCGVLFHRFRKAGWL
jgi:magnesium transporter